MSDRREFLLRAGAFVGALVVARIPVPEVVEEEAVAFAAPSLVASGGLCAPVTPYYSLFPQARPLRDALPEFSVERGL